MVPEVSLFVAGKKINILRLKHKYGWTGLTGSGPANFNRCYEILNKQSSVSVKVRKWKKCGFRGKDNFVPDLP